MQEVVVGEDGRIRRDRNAVRTVVGAARGHDPLMAVVDGIGDVPAKFGSAGMLLDARLASSGEHVLVKVNASRVERQWLPAMHRVDPGLVPAVFGHGDRLGDLDVGWIVLERLPHQPPGMGAPGWYEPLMRAAHRWHNASSQLDLEPLEDLDASWFAFWIDALLDLDPFPELERLRERLDEDWDWITSLCPPVLAHGDVHFFNAGSRSQAAPGSLVLFDPIPRRAPWPYDAANCHTLTGYPAVVPRGEPLVAIAAGLRREDGLPTPEPDEVERISTLMCAWLAVMWRTLFREAAPDRRDTAAAYVSRAVQEP